MLDILLLPELQCAEQAAGIAVRSGGSAANTAAWLAALGEEVTFVGCVGDDAIGDMLRRELTTAGTHPYLRTVPDTDSGSVAVEVTAAGERLMRSARGANQALAPEDVRSLASPGFTWVHLTGYTLLGAHGFELLQAAVEVARAAGARLSFDPSSVGVINRLGRVALLRALSAASVDLLLPNREEAVALSKEASLLSAAVALGAVIPLVVIKDGAAGAVWGTATGADRVMVEVRQAVDTTGAGDAFNAGMLVGLSRGLPPPKACALGHATATRVIMEYGGRPPRRDQT